MSNLATTMTISGFLEVGAGARPRVEGVNDVFSNQLWRFTLGELRGAVLCFHAFHAATPFYCEAPEMFCGLRNSIWLSISVEGGEDDWMLVFRLYCSWWVAFIVCMMNHISQRAKLTCKVKHSFDSSLSDREQNINQSCTRRHSSFRQQVLSPKKVGRQVCV